MKEVWVTAYPFTVREGYIDVPDEITDSGKIKSYITAHWDEITFCQPDFDYRGTDFDISVD